MIRLLRFSLAAVALSMIVPLIAFAEAEDKPAPERWFIGPRIGVSPYKGFTTGQKNTENDVWLIPEVAIGYSF